MARELTWRPASPLVPWRPGRRRRRKRKEKEKEEEQESIVSGVARTRENPLE